VFVEVWTKDIQVVASNPVLVARAVAALRGTHTWVERSDIPWTDEPVTGEKAGEVFLGRLIVDLWSNQAIVGVSGAEPAQVLQRGLGRLEGLAESLSGKHRREALAQARLHRQ
jgi:hypothetical protein